MADPLPFGMQYRDKLFPGEDLYFHENPGTTGMAAEDNTVIMNPYSGLTPEQRAAFKDTEYLKDENALRATIAARIFAGDSSLFPIDKATPEQLDFVLKNLQGK